MTSVKAVIWDIDGVWYAGISTTICARHSELDPAPFHEQFMKERWYTEEAAEKWMKATGRQLKKVDDLAQMLTDFFYGLKKGGKVVCPRESITKEQIVKGKQAILRGLTMKQIREAADNTAYNPGLKDAVCMLRANGLRQIGFSDGLGPFVHYVMLEKGLDHREAPRSIVKVNGKEEPFKEPMLYQDSIRLAGKADPYNKGEAIVSWAEKNGVPLNCCAAIDDSAANIATLKKIHEAGGIAVGYQVNDADAFKGAGIPVLKGKDLRAFAEIVLDPSKVSAYCG